MGTDESEDQTLLIQDPVKPSLELIRNIGQLHEHAPSQYLGGDIFDAIDKAIPILQENS